MKLCHIWLYPFSCFYPLPLFVICKNQTYTNERFFFFLLWFSFHELGIPLSLIRTPQVVAITKPSSKLGEHFGIDCCHECTSNYEREVHLLKQQPFWLQPIVQVIFQNGRKSLCFGYKQLSEDFLWFEERQLCHIVIILADPVHHVLLHTSCKKASLPIECSAVDVVDCGQFIFVHNKLRTASAVKQPNF